MSIQYLQGFEGDARKFKFTAGADQVAGDVIVDAGRVGMVYHDVLDTEEGLAIYATDENGISLPKATGVIARNAIVYWDADGDPIGGTSGAGGCTATSTANIRIGRCVVAAASGDARVIVEMIPDHTQQ